MNRIEQVRDKDQYFAFVRM